MMDSKEPSTTKQPPSAAAAAMEHSYYTTNDWSAAIHPHAVTVNHGLLQASVIVLTLLAVAISVCRKMSLGVSEHSPPPMLERQTSEDAQDEPESIDHAQHSADAMGISDEPEGVQGDAVELINHHGGEYDSNKAFGHTNTVDSLTQEEDHRRHRDWSLQKVDDLFNPLLLSQAAARTIQEERKDGLEGEPMQKVEMNMEQANMEKAARLPHEKPFKPTRPQGASMMGEHKSLTIQPALASTGASTTSAESMQKASALPEGEQGTEASSSSQSQRDWMRIPSDAATAPDAINGDDEVHTHLRDDDDDDENRGLSANQSVRDNKPSNSTGCKEGESLSKMPTEIPVPEGSSTAPSLVLLPSTASDTPYRNGEALAKMPTDIQVTEVGPTEQNVVSRPKTVSKHKDDSPSQFSAENGLQAAASDSKHEITMMGDIQQISDSVASDQGPHATRRSAGKAKRKIPVDGSPTADEPVAKKKSKTAPEQSAVTSTPKARPPKPAPATMVNAPRRSAKSTDSKAKKRLLQEGEDEDRKPAAKQQQPTKSKSNTLFTKETSKTAREFGINKQQAIQADLKDKRQKSWHNIPPAVKYLACTECDFAKPFNPALFKQKGMYDKYIAIKVNVAEDGRLPADLTVENPGIRAMIQPYKKFKQHLRNCIIERRIKPHQDRMEAHEGDPLYIEKFYPLMCRQVRQKYDKSLTTKQDGTRDMAAYRRLKKEQDAKDKED